jgi:SAM-dependent methyltransferase
MQSTLAARQDELEQLQDELTKTADELETLKILHQEQGRLTLSKQRWRGDEPDNGLTWGVRMVGDEFIRFLRDRTALNGSSVVVEIGPGYGRILQAFLQAGLPFQRYIGIEISKARVERLRQQFQDPRIEFREADILADFDLNGVADLTFSSAVFEHLYPDFSIALNTISRFTRPGGAVVIDFIRDDNDTDRAAAWFDKETYMRLYPSKELKEFFQKSGLHVQDIRRISFGNDINGREISRNAVFSVKGARYAGPEESFEAADAQARELPGFDTFVHRASTSHSDRSLDPPVKPEFRSSFGGLWTDLSTADAILTGKTTIGALTPGEGKLLDAWRRDGFVILPGAVPAAAIDAALVDFERAYDGAFGLKMSYWDTEGLHRVDASRDYVRKQDAKLLDLHAVSPAIQSIIFSEALSRFLHILFERPSLAFQSLGFYYGSQQPLHVDSAFVRVNSPLEFVASWIALEDIQPGSGELVYYPGSHALPPHLFGGSRIWVEYDDPELNRFSDELESRAKEAGLRLQRFLPKKGDVLVWSAALMHGGASVTNPNLTRKSLVTHYCPADLAPMFAYKGRCKKQPALLGHYVISDPG